MRGTKVVVAILVIAFMAAAVWFLYSWFANSRNVPPEVISDAGYKIALADALRLKYAESAAAAILFSLLVLGAAALRFPVTSFLRTILCAAAALLLVWVVACKVMENRLQLSYAGAPLPPEALTVAFQFAAFGILFAIGFFFITERIHERRLGR